MSKKETKKVKAKKFIAAIPKKLTVKLPKGIDYLKNLDLKPHPFLPVI